jgi:hypothetical protein
MYTIGYTLSVLRTVMCFRAPFPWMTLKAEEQESEHWQRESDGANCNANIDRISLLEETGSLKRSQSERKT